MSAHRVVAFSMLLLTTLGAVFIGLSRSTSPAETIAASPRAPAAITQLTHDPANAIRPAWSPDNRRIAFESNRDGTFHLYLINADGSHECALTSGPNDDRHPVWTPNGKFILYDSFDGIRQDIWSVNVADGSRKQLTHLDGMADYVAPSPDGERIAFYLYKDMRLNLWSARADGSDAKPLTLDLADARRDEPTMAWHEPAWSPDSQWLAFTGGDGRSIWMMRHDGSDMQPVIVDDEDNHFPWFLADGRLAFITEYVPPRYGAAWTNAWAYDLQTGQRTLLQEFMCMQGPVDWSADNSKILFHSPRGGRFDIYLIELNAPGGLAALQGNLASGEPDEGE
ncbi:MAG: PD40 domain-containing protein [Chloroflexi bacterium]|nr:PD40 domain-containing protein [Chloroflexota bacterium]